MLLLGAPLRLLVGRLFGGAASLIHGEITPQLLLAGNTDAMHMRVISE
jgi:hypothetical protein